MVADDPYQQNSAANFLGRYCVFADAPIRDKQRIIATSGVLKYVALDLLYSIVMQSDDELVIA
jgi:hypothetical protein